MNCKSVNSSCKDLTAFDQLAGSFGVHVPTSQIFKASFKITHMSFDGLLSDAIKYTVWSNDLWLLFLLFFTKVFIKYVEEIRWNLQTCKISMQCLLTLSSQVFTTIPPPPPPPHPLSKYWQLCSSHLWHFHSSFSISKVWCTCTKSA